MNNDRLLCDNCGNILLGNELEQKTYYVGEVWGAPAYAYKGICPLCGNDSFSEIEICESCGKDITNNVGYEGLCEDCIMENATLSNAIAIGLSGCDGDEISHFYTDHLSRDEINQILKTHIQNNMNIYKDIIYDYCKANMDVLAYIVAERRETNE